MRTAILIIATLAAIALTPTIDAQTAEPASASKVVSSDIDRLLREQLHYYFATDQREPAVAHVAKLNGTNFEDLQYGQSISEGVLAGRLGGVPLAGSKIQGTFKDQSITFHGRADGKGGFKSIESVAVAEGTRITLRDGKKYMYAKGLWKLTER